MIIGIGCDIVNHQTTIQLNWNSSSKVLERIFSSEEILLCKSKTNEIRFIAGRFAAKEAILKSMGTGMQDGFSLTEIEVLQASNGKPVLKMSDGFQEFTRRAGIKSFHISISHTHDCSIAYVIAEGE